MFWGGYKAVVGRIEGHSATLRFGGGPTFKFGPSLKGEMVFPVKILADLPILNEVLSEKDLFEHNLRVRALYTSKSFVIPTLHTLKEAQNPPSGAMRAFGKHGPRVSKLLPICR